jgi:hypothetical protein
MNKCIGNCALCKLEVDKAACCSIQTLKNIIEVKKLLKALLEKDDVYKGLENIESEETNDTELDVPGADGVGQ